MTTGISWLPKYRLLSIQINTIFLPEVAGKESYIKNNAALKIMSDPVVLAIYCKIIFRLCVCVRAYTQKKIFIIFLHFH